MRFPYLSAHFFFSSIKLIETSDNTLGHRDDANKHHTALLAETQATGRQTSQTISTELGQRITEAEDKISRKVDRSESSMTTVVNQSVAAMSQTLTAEMSHTLLPAQGASVISAISREIRDSKGSLEGAVSSSTAEILSAVNAQAHATQQLSIALASLVGGDSDSQMPYDSTANSLMTSHQTQRRNRKNRNKPVSTWMSTGCTCRRNAPSAISTRSYSWIFSKESNGTIHERNCPLWYQSQISTQYGVRFALLQRLGIFGHVSISGSPYQSMFGWSIGHSLSLAPVVPSDSPAFRVIQHHFFWSSSKVDVRRCLQDLAIIFRSGQGSPADTLLDGTTLMQVRSFDIFVHVPVSLKNSFVYSMHFVCIGHRQSLFLQCGHLPKSFMSMV